MAVYMHRLEGGKKNSEKIVDCPDKVCFDEATTYPSQESKGGRIR